MPYSPLLADALAGVALPWPSAPLAPAVSKGRGIHSAEHVPADFYDTLAALDAWHTAHLKHTQGGRDALQIQSGTKVQHRDELCETADARTAPTEVVTDPKKHAPRLLVCHDFQGGYNDRPHRRGYTFEYWHLADIFVYFSHRRISCPPAGWNAAGARHGVKMLGTIIFEWKEAMQELSLLLRGPHDLYSPLGAPLRFSGYYIPALVELALANNFNGYLVNIELGLDLGFSVSGYTWYPDWLRPTTAAQRDEMQRNARRLRAWVALLRSEGRRRFELAGRDPDEWTVLWYDSVTKDGELQWQDAVTTKNTPFLEVTDGIFTNYTWARPPRPTIEQPDMPGGPAPPPSSVTAAAQQELNPYHDSRTALEKGEEVHPALAHSGATMDSVRRPRAQAFIGIDCFGRNCFGGAETWQSLDMIGTAAWWEPARPHGRGGGGGRQTEVGVKLQRKLDIPLPSFSGAVRTQQLGELGLSVALFAPGWTWEHAEPGTVGPVVKDTFPSVPANESSHAVRRRTWHDFAETDRLFWVGRDVGPLSKVRFSGDEEEPVLPYWKQRYFRSAISAYFPYRAPPLLSSAGPPSRTSGPKKRVLYHTTSARGSGTAWYHQGRKVAQWRAPDPQATPQCQDSRKTEEEEEEEDERREHAERARVLLGWTDAGVSLPKADAGHGRQYGMRVAPPQDAGEEQSRALPDPPQTRPDHHHQPPQEEAPQPPLDMNAYKAEQYRELRSRAVDLVEEEGTVWAGATATRVRLSYASWPKRGPRTEAVDLAWVGLPLPLPLPLPAPAPLPHAHESAPESVSTLASSAPSPAGSKASQEAAAAAPAPATHWTLEAAARIRFACPLARVRLALDLRALPGLEAGAEPYTDPRAAEVRASSPPAAAAAADDSPGGVGGAPWKLVTARFRVPIARGEGSRMHPLWPAPQAVLGLVVDLDGAGDGEEVERGRRDGWDGKGGDVTDLDFYVGELSLVLVEDGGEADGSGQTATAVVDPHRVEVRLGGESDSAGLATLSWPDFAPAAHFYEVFAQREGGTSGTEEGEQGRIADEAPLWLGTATRERSRTEFVVPLPAVRAALGIDGGHKGRRVTFTVRPFGSIWGDEHAKGSA